MPHLFSLPGPRNGPDNTTEQQFLADGADIVIGAGNNVFASLARLYWANHNVVTFTNHGTIWNISPQNTGSILSGFYIEDFINTGLIVVEATNGNAGGVFVGAWNPSLDNSGSIYAIANGNAEAITHYDPDTVIRNTGLIVAYAPSASTPGNGGGGVGSAIGIATFNGGVVLNGEDGQILAEGVFATAILFGRGDLFGNSGIVNEGRIEAFSLTAGSPAYGIRTGGYAVEFIKFENSGLLKADIAWSSYGEEPYSPKASDTITNLFGGQIVGRIETGRGSDTLVNSGTITGDVALGDENDLLDTRTGTLTGAVDLGWNDDSFLGSAAGDVAKGNRGNDFLFGGGGNDLLLGGIGDDQIGGQAGNDGLYGELGEDYIVTAGGDAAYGGDGDDAIAAGDLNFALISGGAGFDTLWLDTGATHLDLSAAIGSGRLQSIERIALQDGQQVAVQLGDAAALGGGTLDIAGGAASLVNLVGPWSEGAASERNGATYRSFTFGGDTVYVQTGVTVSITGAIGAGFAGLDAIAGGGAAPQAGSVPGGELSNPVMNISWYHLDRTTVIDVGETWQSSGAPVIEGFSITESLINAGLITATNGPSVFHAVGNDIAHITNTGTIRGTGAGTAPMDAINIRGTLENWGTVEVVTDQGQAMAAVLTAGTETRVMDNHGAIVARSSTGAAIGAQIGNANIFQPDPIGFNAGTIDATGGAGTIGLKLLSGGLFVNEGTIIARNSAASGAHDALGVQLYYAGVSTSNFLDNRGTITGVTAIRSDAGVDQIFNSGQINGAVQLGDGGDLIENRGAINGSIDLGADSDQYLGAAATAAASVAGGAGLDLLVGGSAADRLEGGDGNDLLIGGGGADVLIGGAGADRFTILAVGDSIAAAADTIQAFESGIDKIDLGAVAPTSVNLSLAAGITTITAQTAAGTVTIRAEGSVTLADLDLTPDGAVLNGTSASEILYATGTGMEFHAGDGDDVLIGTSGADLLFGEGGADLMRGGGGDDTYIVDSTGDRVVEGAGQGTDLVLSSVMYALPDWVENVTLIYAGSDPWALGNALDNRIIGTTVKDWLGGADGNDVLIGDGGGDNLTGGEGIDTYVYRSATDSTSTEYDTISNFESGIDKIDLTALAVSSVSWTSNIFDQFAGTYRVVTVQTSGGAMTIRVSNNLNGNPLAMSDFILTPPEPGRHLAGTAGSDYLQGGTGDDIIDGGAGHDTLIGSAGLDTMNGGAGDDNFFVDTIDDLALEANGEGIDSVYTTASYILREAYEVERLFADPASGTSALNLTGNSLANNIQGNAGANVLLGNGGDDLLVGFAGNDTLDGGAGNDTLLGGFGDDTYILDNVNDVVVENAGEGRDTIFTPGDYTLREIEQVELLLPSNQASTAPINLSGNSLANIIYGNAGANVLLGNGGADILLGQGGDDILDGGTGADTLTGGTGDDIYYVDTVDDVIVENSGGGTNDRLFTTATYILREAEHVEQLLSASQSATTAMNLTGNSRDNILQGNNGANILDGKGGNDVLLGFEGSDTFVFSAPLNSATNVDTIVGFTVASDKILLDGTLPFSSLAAGTLAASAFTTGSQATTADHRIVYDSTTGGLFFDPDGSGATAAFQFAILSPGLALTNANFVVADPLVYAASQPQGGAAPAAALAPIEPADFAGVPQGAFLDDNVAEPDVPRSWQVWTVVNDAPVAADTAVLFA